MSKTIYGSILLMSAAHAVTDLPQGALLVALPFLKAKFALTYTQTSVIILVQSLTSSISQPIFGYFSDKKSRPWLMPAGCILSGVGFLLSLLVPSYELMLVFTFLSGLGVAIFHPEGAKTAHQLSGNSQGKGVSLFVVGGTAGMALGSLLLAALLVNGPGWQLFLYVVPSLAIALPVSRLTKKIPLRQGKQNIRTGFSRQFFSGSLLALLGAILIRAMVSSGLSTFIPLYFISFLGGDPLLSSTILTIYLASGAMGTLTGGALSDRFGSKQVMLWSIAPAALVIYAFQSASGAMVYLLLAIASMLLAAAHSSSLVLAQRMMPGNVGMASGLSLGFSFGVGALGVLALGRVADLWSLPVVFDILALLPLVGLVCTFFVRDPAAEALPEATRVLASETEKR